MELIPRDLQQCNVANRDGWQRYTPHRKRVTDHLLAACRSTQEPLCILGAGNCNDLDLSRLVDVCSKIHLVDLDRSALQWGVEQQGFSRDPRVVIQGEVDVSGLLRCCADWRNSPPTDDQFERALSIAASHQPFPLHGLFQTTASVGLLSQLILALVKSLGTSRPGFLRLLETVRGRHLQCLAELTRPGGEFLLVTDLVSSDTCPRLKEVSLDELPGLLQRLLAERNFFTGLHPLVITSLLRQSPALAPLVERVEVSAPWLWDFGRRTYACYAVHAARTNVPLAGNGHSP